MYYVILTASQELAIIDYSSLEDCLLRGAKEQYKGSKEECDNYVEELGYTGPIWENCKCKIEENEIK